MLLKGLAVLVVEDEPMISDIIEDMLIRLGADSVAHAKDNEAAFAALRYKKPDVAMLDVNMNGIEVYPVAAKLAADNIPFIFSTALEREALLPPWNMRTALKKPFTEEQLHVALKDAVDAILF
jgi:CheY-like chemotaxis protein